MKYFCGSKFTLCITNCWYKKDMRLEALRNTGKPKLEEEGFSLDVCTEAEIDGVATLSQKEKNALKMIVRQRQLNQPTGKPSQSNSFNASVNICLHIFSTRVRNPSSTVLLRFFLFCVFGTL